MPADVDQVLQLDALAAGRKLAPGMA